jgi:hypothetical protein
MAHHDHERGHPHSHTSSNIRTAFFLNLGFALLEIVGGLWTNSLAILSDALHDFGARFRWVRRGIWNDIPTNAKTTSSLTAIAGSHCWER